MRYYCKMTTTAGHNSSAAAVARETAHNRARTADGVQCVNSSTHPNGTDHAPHCSLVKVPYRYPSTNIYSTVSYVYL